MLNGCILAIWERILKKDYRVTMKSLYKLRMELPMKAFASYHPVVLLAYFLSVILIAVATQNPAIRLLALGGGFCFCSVLERPKEMCIRDSPEPGQYFEGTPSFESFTSGLPCRHPGRTFGDTKRGKQRSVSYTHLDVYKRQQSRCCKVDESSMMSLENFSGKAGK